jgi:hypothetical protein
MEASKGSSARCLAGERSAVSSKTKFNIWLLQHATLMESTRDTKTKRSGPKNLQILIIYIKKLELYRHRDQPTVIFLAVTTRPSRGVGLGIC